VRVKSYQIYVYTTSRAVKLDLEDDVASQVSSFVNDDTQGNPLFILLTFKQ